MIYTPHEYADLFPLMSGHEFNELKQDIKANGLKIPVVMLAGKILDGRNRFKACQDVNVDILTVEYSGVDPLADVISWNLKRRHLDEGQRGLVAARLANMPVGRNWNNANYANLQNNAPVTQSSAAEMLNVSQRTVSTAKRVIEEAIPELIDEVNAGHVSISTAAIIATVPEVEQRSIVAMTDKEIVAKAKEIRNTKLQVNRSARIKKLIEISANNAPLSANVLCPVILCDPPWRYEHSESSVRDIENHYPTMTHDELCALPIDSVALSDCIMFMWATSPKLAESIDLLKAWGFSYRTCAVWDKEIIGMGYYFRQQHELLLVATRGNVPTPMPGDRVSSVIRSRREAHSKKPECVYEIIESMYPELPKLEMFCRDQRNGWLVWGNQS